MLSTVDSMSIRAEIPKYQKLENKGLRLIPVGQVSATQNGQRAALTFKEPQVTLYTQNLPFLLQFLEQIFRAKSGMQLQSRMLPTPAVGCAILRSSLHTF